MKHQQNSYTSTLRNAGSVRGYIQQGRLDVGYVPTAKMVADGLTKLEENSTLLKSTFKYPLLGNALGPVIPSRPVADPRSITSTPLNQGCNPNDEYFRRTTIRVSFLKDFVAAERHYIVEDSSARLHEQQRELLQPLLAKGADANVRYQNSTLFGYILNEIDELHATRAEQHMSLLELFLSYGADPNGKFDGSTAWRNRISTNYNRRNNMEFDHLKPLVCREIELLLQHGANPSTETKQDGFHKQRVKTREIVCPNTQTVAELIETCFPDRAEHLLQVSQEGTNSRGSYMAEIQNISEYVWSVEPSLI